MVASEDGGPVRREPIASPAALQAAREARGWSRLDVARQIKFQVRQIAALENGRFDELPGHAFVRGALRSYANLLAVDVSPLLAVLGGHAQPAELKGPLRQSAAARLAEMDVEFEPAVTHSRRMNMAWGVGGVAVVVLLLGVFGGGASFGPAERWLSQVRQDARTAQPSSPQAPGGDAGQVVEQVRWPVSGTKAAPVSQSVASRLDVPAVVPTPSGVTPARGDDASSPKAGAPVSR
ncbi:MAG: helix-turn-helix transcriptional regulator [Lautropia sp.]|nr:helix-turn-helix transcriptional regulator [Lautropia sp.]